MDRLTRRRVSTAKFLDSNRRVESREKPVIQRKIRRAREIAERLAQTPFVRLMALGNSVAMGTATEMSDLDLFVVTAPNRLWTTRALLLLKAKWLGLTKRPGRTADQADFGFWVDETTLDLSPIALRADSLTPPPAGDPAEGRIDDPYLSRWLATLIPLVDRGRVYAQLIAANTALLSSYPTSGVGFPRIVILKPLAAEESLDVSQKISQSFTPLRTTLLVERILRSPLGEPIEWLLFQLQRAKVWADPVTQRIDPLTVGDWPDHPEQRRRIDVVTTRHMLKLHHLDAREKYRVAIQNERRGRRSKTG